jgi:DNA-binding PadR family transcriptional regulator
VDQPGQEDERTRRFYRLTRQGWSTLREEIDRLQRLLDHAQSMPRLRKAGLA